MVGVVVICAEASANVRVVMCTSNKIRATRDVLGWAKLREMHGSRILSLQSCDANEPRGLREELDLCCKEPTFTCSPQYERDMNGSEICRVDRRSEEPIDPQSPILPGTMPSPKTDVKKNLDFGNSVFRAVIHCCLFHHTFPPLPAGVTRKACDFNPVLL